MSEYVSRMHIKVSSPEIWRKFEDEDDADFDLARFADTDKTSCIVGDGWSAFENELFGIVNALAKTLGKDGIIIADTTNLNVDPYDCCILFLGEAVQTEVFDCDDDKCEMFFKTNIENIPEWLNYGKFYISQKEKDVLFRCGIAMVGKHFEEFSTNLEFPEKIYLRETSFDKRPETIENISIGDEVYFVHAKDSYDPLRLEVMSDSGSLGYLPSDISDKITPAIVNKRLKYTAKVTEVVPASKRNKHAKSSVVAIGINAEFSNSSVSDKTSVSKKP